jgi:hypothetical protein
MLNELADLRRSLAEQGIRTAPWHPSVQPLRKGTAVIVEVDDKGSPVSVSSLPPAQAAELRNIQPDFQKRFPTFNLDCPLFDDESLIRSAANGLYCLEPLVATATLTCKTKDILRIGRSLYEFPARELAPLFTSGSAAINPVLDSTRALLQSLASSTLGAEGFLRTFAVAALHSVGAGGLDHELLLQILLGKLNKGGGRDPWQLLIFLDIADAGSFTHRIADPAVAVAWSHAMLSATIPESEALATLQCSLSGDRGESAGKKMPSPNLPLLGGTYLMAMNSDIPAQTRYGHSSTDIFPMAKQTVQELNDSLLHITAPERKGRTWGPVASGTQDKPDLLIAYIEGDTESDLPLASVLGDDDDWREDEESSDGPNQEDSRANFTNSQSSFEIRTKSLIEAIQLNPELMREDVFLRVFVISTIDKGRKQILFDRRYSVRALFRAQERWITGARNVPTIAILVPQGKGKRGRLYPRHIPTPVAVLKGLRQQWIRGGSMSQTVPGIDLRRIYNLLLEDHAEHEAMWMLERLLPLSQVLLMGAGRPYIDQKKSGDTRVVLQAGGDLPVEARRPLLTVIALYGILLHRLGRYKEDYMEGRDFLLGQFLQCADELHLLYCEHVRGGSVPPQLIGNAALPMALENPVKAVGVLSARVPIYIAWLRQKANAKTTSAANGAQKEFSELSTDEKGMVKAKSIYNRLGDLSAKLHNKLDDPVSLTGRAELLLGYLAREQRTYPPSSPRSTSEIAAPLTANGENA